MKTHKILLFATLLALGTSVSLQAWFWNRKDINQRKNDAETSYHKKLAQIENQKAKAKINHDTNMENINNKKRHLEIQYRKDKTNPKYKDKKVSLDNDLRTEHASYTKNLGDLKSKEDNVKLDYQATKSTINTDKKKMEIEQAETEME